MSGTVSGLTWFRMPTVVDLIVAGLATSTGTQLRQPELDGFR